ncbi:MAG: universal stress protein [Notoacmeibacter sp.]|nr:universal stress protein [Notoacmeibacter sp.]MCC0032926.1 universal stress protein [Brucellaceae bacterium]
MTYKTIVAIMPDLTVAERVFSAAAVIARKFGSHVIAVHAEPSAAAYATPIGFPEAGVLESNIEESRQRAEDLKEKVNEMARVEAMSFEWRSMESFIGDSAVSGLNSAHCADLVIAGQPDPDNTKSIPNDVEVLIFDSGRPVLFVPYAARIPSEFKTVVVAWNGTREAARATFDAMPFLHAADRVEIFTVDPASGSDQTAVTAGAEIATVLARHGVKVATETQISDGVKPAAIIENRLADTQADLLVMGAYSHSRILERLFGGVTRTVMKSMPTLTLMSR